MPSSRNNGTYGGLKVDLGPAVSDRDGTMVPTDEGPALADGRDLQQQRRDDWSRKCIPTRSFIGYETQTMR